MATESLTPLVSAIGVAIGLGILLAGVGLHGAEVLRPIGGVVILLSVGLLALFIDRLEPASE